MEMVLDLERRPSPKTRANTDHDKVSVRQVSLAALRGDSQVDQTSLIRDTIHEELGRGLGRRSRRSEREGSSSLEGSR